MPRYSHEKPPSIEALGGELPLPINIYGSADEGLDNDVWIDDNVSIRFRGNESPQERGRRIYERLHPAGRPLLPECATCAKGKTCGQRGETDSGMTFICFDRSPLKESHP